LILGLWKILSLVIASDIILPSPERTIWNFLGIFFRGRFLLDILFSVYRGLIGFTVSVVLGVMVGLFAGFNNFFSRLIEPVIIIIKSTPVLSIILLALIWFRSANVPVFASFLVAFPIISSNIMEGVKATDYRVIEMARIYNIKRIKIIKDIYFPSIMSFLIAALTTAVGIGWKAVIAAEVLSQPDFAIGTKMQLSRIFLQTEMVLAWTMVAVLLSYSFEKIIRRVERNTIRWK
jgi:NitT/TauT family transport system permease protein